MKKGTMNTLIISMLVVLVFAIPFLVQGAKPACNDNIDNDGDGLTDYPDDLGCNNNGDKDETDCGDNVVSGSEVCDGTDLDGETCVSQGFDGGTLGCVAACNAFDTSNCFTDSCSDSDGGFNTGTQGTASGENGGTPFSHTDSCTGSILTEWFCSGTSPSSGGHDCNTAGNQSNGTTMCVNGACQ